MAFKAPNLRSLVCDNAVEACKDRQVGKVLTLFHTPLTLLKLNIGCGIYAVSSFAMMNNTASHIVLKV
jgi:hypothetical protein